jgi:hypothetical protein
MVAIREVGTVAMAATPLRPGSYLDMRRIFESPDWTGALISVPGEDSGNES